MDLGTMDRVEQGSLDTFKDLGLKCVLQEACSNLGWKTPTRIQKEVIPLVLQGKDVIALAEDGSGKTGAFMLPLLQCLLEENPQGLFGLVLTPTENSALQIAAQIEALGCSTGVKCGVIVSGMNWTSQSINCLAKGLHIMIATPDCLVDHLENMKDIVTTLKFLIMENADQMLATDCEEVDKILQMIPRQRRTLLFSANMTSKVEKVGLAYLVEPVKVQVSSKYEKDDSIFHYYIYARESKDLHLVRLLDEAAGDFVLVFCALNSDAFRISLLLGKLGIAVVSLHNGMSEDMRLIAFDQFKSGSHRVLVATDVVVRNYIIPSVHLVVNYDIPFLVKDYVFRVCHAARRSGRNVKAITLLDDYQLVRFLRIESFIMEKFPQYPMDDVKNSLRERVEEAKRLTEVEIRELEQEGLTIASLDERKCSPTRMVVNPKILQ